MSVQSHVRRVVDAMVDLGGRRPLLVIAWATAVMLACWSYTRKLEVRSDIMELLPRDSPGFQSFERRLERVGGRATLTVVCESPDRAANERFIDAVDERLRKITGDRDACAARCAPGAEGETCRTACGPDLIGSIESGTKDIHAFFEANKWLYANIADLEEADSTLDRQIAIKSGMVEDLLDESSSAEHALGMDRFKERWKKHADDKDDFPTGYFASKDGTQIALRIMSTTSGLGGGKDEELLQLVERVTTELAPSSFHPEMKVGFGGDIPNAAAEKESLVREALMATVIAAVLILGGVIWFYGSPWSLLLIGFPPLFGVGCAYAFATWNYGYVNASGVFLGAIILGNGVNYPIVLYSRYKEFRARGMEPDPARREAVWNAFRAELVGSTVASIAYGSLTVTRFRGFNQFGVIGFFGMLLVWISMIPCLPALIVLVERWQKHVPRWLQERPATLDNEGSRGPIARWVGNATARWPHYFVIGATFVTLALALRLPSFLKDPWEYNFDKLGSKGARTSGAFQWSAKADRILAGRMNLAGSLVLADHPNQVPDVKERILANDAADPEGAMIDTITTLDDFLPGPPEAQKAKLEVLERLRERLTPKVLSSLVGRGGDDGTRDDPARDAARPRLEGPSRPPQDTLLRARRHARHDLLHPIQAGDRTKRRAQPAANGEYDRRRPSGRRNARRHRQPSDRLRRDDPLPRARRTARHRSLVHRRARRRDPHDVVEAGLLRGDPVARPRRRMDDGQRRDLRRPPQLPQLHRLADHLRHRIGVPVQHLRPLAPPRRRRHRSGEAALRRGRALQLHDDGRLRLAPLRGQPGDAVLRSARHRRRDRLLHGGGPVPPRAPPPHRRAHRSADERKRRLEAKGAVQARARRRRPLRAQLDDRMMGI